MIGRSTKQILDFFLIAILGIAMLGGLCAWRLAQGPVKLEFLNSYIEGALNDLGVPFVLTIQNTHIAWAGWHRGLELKISGLNAKNEINQVVTFIDETAIRFSLKGFLHGVIAPKSIVILGPSVKVLRTNSGVFKFSMGSNAKPIFTEIDYLKGIATILNNKNDPTLPITYLQRVSILKANLVLDDQKTGRFWRARNTNLALAADSGDRKATFSTELDIEGHWTNIDGKINILPEKEKILMQTEVRNLRLDTLADRIDKLRPFKIFRMALDGKVNAECSFKGIIQSINFDLKSDEGEIAHKILWPKILDIESSRWLGSIDLINKYIDLKDIRLNLSSTSAAITAKIQENDRIISVSSKVKVKNLKVDDIYQLWPSTVMRNERRWVSQNIYNGYLPEATVLAKIKLDTRNGAIEFPSVTGNAFIEDTNINYMEGAPEISNVYASVLIASDKVTFNIQGGESRGVAIDKGTVIISKIGSSNQIAIVDLSLLGSIKDKLALIKMLKIGYSKRFVVAPKKFGGSAVTRLKLELPLISEIKHDDIQLRVESITKDASILGVAAGKNIRNGNFIIKINLDGLEVVGNGRVSGAPIKIRWIERFEGNTKYFRRIEARGVLAQPQWEGLGFKTFADRLSGPVGIDLAFLTPTNGKRTEVVAKLQFQHTTIRVEELAWRKKPGNVALAWVTAILDQNGSINVRNFNLATAGLKMSGSAFVNSEGNLVSIDVQKFLVKDKADLNFRITPDNVRGGLFVSLKGKFLDATYLPEASLYKFSNIEKNPVSIQFDIEGIKLPAKIKLKNSVGQLIRKNNGLWNGELVSQMTENVSMKLDLNTTELEKKIIITSDNAGEIMKYFDISNAVKGGKLRVRIKKNLKKPQHGWAGVAEIKNFSVINAPVLARMFTLASLTGLLNALSGEGISFVRFHAPLRWQDNRLRFANARTVGSELGLTGEGTFDLKRDTLDVKGTIVPAYTINSVLGNIPLLGNIFTGKKGSGVFAVNYRVIGPISNPGVKVNPLSALAPGFLRNLVGIFDLEPTKKASP
ncbi:MAG: hypothetical protein CMM44_04355 [Rhodospirillaceae bacterium]|nr:hypothetical protein [Rhodospirillaceae bacterium]